MRKKNCWKKNQAWDEGSQDAWSQNKAWHTNEEGWRTSDDQSSVAAVATANKKSAADFKAPPPLKAPPPPLKDPPPFKAPPPPSPKMLP